MKKSEFKNPNAMATQRQTFAIFCMSKVDVRDESLTRWDASQLISKLKESKGTPQEKAEVVEKYIRALNNKTAAELFEKAGIKHPFTVKAVVDHKRKSSKKVSTPLAILAEAQAAGLLAMAQANPTPMVVQQHANMADDNSPVVQQWTVPGGVCGFAWVVVKCKGPGVKFINALKKIGKAGGENSFCEFTRSSYHGGFYHHIHEGGQSMELKIAYAEAFAEVLGKHGIPCVTGNRMD